MDDVLIETTQDRLRVLTMNRPQRRNAMDAALCDRLAEAAARAAQDDAVTAVLLRGAGESFCVGGDVKAMAEGGGREETFEARVDRLRRWVEVSRLLHRMRKPTVAAVQGAAAGGGLSLALACDLRIVARSAKFTTAFAKVGLSGDFGGTWFLTRIVGTARARDLYLRPRLIGADEALAIGLVTEVVDDDALEPAALALAAALAAGPATALAYIKQNLDHAETGSLENALDLEATRHIRCTYTEDHREAASAFVEKRPPNFKGR